MAQSYLRKYDDAKKEQEASDRKAEAESRRLEGQRERDAARHARDEQQRSAERERLTSELAREDRVASVCTASEPARAARKRHQDILQTQAPAATVRKQCTPRNETHAVKSECKDANGFSRECTKTVAGDVVGYVCPKTMDPEVVQLGLYQLDLLDAYPYPEDRSVRVSDADCERAKTRTTELRTKLEALAPAGGAQ